MTKFIDLIKATLKEWSEDKAARLAAALAYYTVFSIPPLLIIVLAIVGQLFDRNAARDQLLAQIGRLIGNEGAGFVRSLLESASKPTDSAVATVISVVTLLLGATGVFGELQGALNTIWEVAPRPGRGLLGTIQDRFLSFTMVLGIAFLLMVSLVISTILAALGNSLAGNPAQASGLLEILNSAVSFVIITVLFALIFKVVPDVQVAWPDVWLGAVMTALLFVIGKFAIGLYLGRSSVASTYGAAGSLVVILIWIYYSAQILFLGAEFTQVYANRYGSHVRPKADAVAWGDEAHAQQGMPHQQRIEKAGSAAAEMQSAGAVREKPAATQPAQPVRQAIQVKEQRNLFYYVGMTLAVLASMWFNLRHRAGH